MHKLKIAGGVAVLCLLSVYVLFPIYWLVVASTKSTQVLFSSGTFTAGGFSSLGKNIHSLFTYTGGIYIHWLVNSFVYAIVAAGIATYISTATGYALAKFKFVGRGALLATVVASLMVPATVLIIPIFILEKLVGLTNSYEGVILPLIASPFSVYFMYIFTQQSLPGALIDSARVDGAGEVRIFHQVAIPVMIPGIVTIFLISFIGTWNNFFLPLVLLGNEKLFPLTVGLSIWLSEIHVAGASQPLYPEVLLGSLVSVLPMLILFPFLRKYVARGLTFGALAAE